MTIQPPIKDHLRTQLSEARLASVWQRVRAQRAPRRRSRVGWVLVPLALATALLLWSRRPLAPLLLASQDPIGVLEAPRQLRTIDTNDGSQITLSPGGRLETVANANRVFDTRLVRGRAEFNVRPGGRRRWLVHAGHVTVEVVGTHFIVDRAAAKVSVTVTRGEVMVRRDGGGSARALRVGESIEMNDPPAAPTPTPTPATAPAPTSVDANTDVKANTPVDEGPESPPEPATRPETLLFRTTGQRIAGADPHLPDAVKRRLKGQPEHSFVTQICVGSDGAVTDVSVVQGIPGADAALVATLRQWRYDRQPIPVCFVTQLVFSVE
jgi:FecR protein